MANEFLLSEYADEAALQKQTAFILQSFDTIEKKALAMGESLKNSFNSIGNTNFNSKELLAELDKIKVASAEFAKTTKIGTDALKTQNEQLAISAKTYNAVSDSLQKNIKSLNDYKVALANITIQQKKLKEQVEAGKITADEYRFANTKLTETQFRYKATIIDLEKAIKKQTATTQELTREQKLQNAVYETERNSLGRAQALILLYTEQKKKLNLATAEGALLNENYNKAIAKTNTFIKANGDEITKQAKNVGNYAGSLGGYFNKIFQSLRTLANIIPGLGLSGIFLIFFDTIKDSISALGIFNTRLADTKRQTQLLADVNKQAADNAGKEIAQLEILYSVATNNNLAIKDRKAAVDELQKQYPDYFKNIGDEIILQGKAKDAYEAARLAILAKAKAQAVEGELTKLEVKELNARQEIEKKLKDLRQAERDKQLADKNNARKSAAERGEDQFFAIAKASEVNKGLKELNQDLIEIDKDRQFLLKQITAPPKTDTAGGSSSSATDRAIQALKDRLNVEFEIYKISQEAKLRQYDEDIKSDKVHYLDKLVALKNYVQASQELINRQQKEDEENAKRKAALDIQRLNEEKAGKTAAQKARINQNIKITEENLQQELLLIQAKYADQSVQLSVNAATIKESILEKEQNKLIDYLNKRLNAEAAYLKKGIDYSYEESKKAYLRRIELDKEYNAKKVALAEQAEKLLFTIGNASFIRQLNAIRDLQDAQEKKAARDIEIVNGSAINEEEKAAKIIVIQARLQAQKEANEKKARDIRVQQAKFERAQQLFEIAIQTIKAVAKIKAEAAVLAANPFTLPLVPVALAQIPLVIASGAVSAGAILAQPIPRFYKGKKKNQPYEGPAIINDNPDGKTLEVLERENGKLEFPDGRNVLTNVKAGDIVHPDRDAFLMNLQRTAMKEVAKKGIMTEGAFVAAMTAELSSRLQQNTSILKKIADKPTQTIKGSERGMVNLIDYGSRQIQYINDNCNW